MKYIVIFETADCDGRTMTTAEFNNQKAAEDAAADYSSHPYSYAYVYAKGEIQDDE